MKIAIKTLGCKSNRYESDVLFERLSGSHEVFELNEGVSTFQKRSQSDFDIAVVNTCTVTHVADRKSRQAVRSLKSANPSCKIVVFGCGSNVAGNEYEAIEEVDLVARNVDEVVDYVQEAGGESDYKSSVDNGVRTRAVVKIQDGCNNYCTYCIIPRARGPEVSYDKDKVLKEVLKREKAGFHEVVLTGIIISNWEKDGMDFVDLVEYLISGTDSIRFRISSIEPQNFNGKFVRLFQNKRVCPHVHMSLQSGSDSVLERMRRKYDTKLYLDVCERLREAVPDIGLTTDVIVGFPGETAEEFEETCEFVRKVGFLKMHVFPYSKREKTAAYHMQNHVEEGVKKSRAKELRKISDDLGKTFVKGLIGNEYDIIVEKSEDGSCTGVTPNYIPVQFFCSNNVDIGKLFRVKLDQVESNGITKASIVPGSS